MYPSIQLKDYDAAVVSALKEKFNWLEKVESYPDFESGIPTPSAFFSIKSWEKNEDQRMNGQLSVILSCEVLAILGHDYESQQLEVRNQAMAISLFLESNQFGLEIEPSVFISAEPDAFDPDLDAYAAWSIRFNQIINVGNDFFAPEGETPSCVNVGYSPDIGADNEDKYESLIP